MAKFKTSARTVDMLGRQQIAGIPTAMSELFKNAYDAYAREVRADYYPRAALMSLRDDGIGMSTDDFLTRWLTLGTDSKTAGSTLKPTSIPPGLKRRQQMGEKGIGRLAIASIAPLVMILTRGTDPDGAGNTVTAALLSWELFETPGLTLDEIEIPVSVVSQPIDPPSVFVDLANQLTVVLKNLRKRLGADRHDRITAQIRAAANLPISSIFGLPGPQIADKPGTVFILFGTGDDLEAAVTAEGDDQEVPEFQRFLGGFTNSITKAPSEVPISSRFVVHRDELTDDLIGLGSFWQSADFEMVDHVIDGEFDASGTFSGSVSLYRGATVPYTLGWGRASRDPRCGPFKLKLGVVQGNPKESRLPADDFVLMSRRLRAQGGIYIYRDDIRVLPYGNVDVDYLQIEKRRTLNAGRYYFSHRRMFGAVELSAKHNPGLQEKAGREGFRQNGSYRDFVEVLEHFLQQVAVDFFRPGGEHSDEYEAQREILTSRAKVRAEKEKRERLLRDVFATRIEDTSGLIDSGDFANQVATFRGDFATRLSMLVDAGVSSTQEWEALLVSARETERRLSDRIDVRRPTALALNAAQERDYEAVRVLIDGALGLLRETAEEVRQAILQAVPSGNAGPSSEPTGRDYLREYSADSVAEARAEASEAVAVVHDVNERLLDELTTITSAMASEIQAIVESERGRGLGSAGIRDKERKIDQTIETFRSRVQGIRETTERVFFDPDVILDNRHLQERVLDLEDEADNNVELMQLGLAVQLVNHELESNIGAVRTGLRRLQPWARANPRLNETVQDIRTAFQHLDGYLRMFTPLQRRLYRRRIRFTGADLLRFCRGVFDERLSRHNVTLVATESFRQSEVFGFPSSFYPVFLNLIDNAIYWTQKSDRDREIRLDASGARLLVSDSGPGITATDRAAVFERGFSRRRGGRGLGLSLASEILAREGWLLDIDEEPGPLGGASFLILRDSSEDEDD